MTTEQFFEKFELFAGAPDAIPRLRQLILELAVRGQLTAPTRPSTPTHPSAPSDSSAEPFTIPEDWHWVRLSEAAAPCGQKKPDTRFTYIDVGAIDNTRGVISDRAEVVEPAKAPSRARKIVELGCVIYATVRPYLRNIAIVDRTFKPPAIASTAFAILSPTETLDTRFLFHWLRSNSFQEIVAAKMKGMAYPAISDTEFWQCPLPLPPLAEQKRIVAKVDELMALCDQLEAQQQERETKHAALSAASLARFAEAPTPANLNFLFHQSYDISPADLRKTILTLAVQGKLVPQDTRDEPAKTLISGIATEKQCIAAKRRAKAKDELPEIADESIPFELPPSWEWARLSHVTRRIHYGYTASAKAHLKDVRLLRITDIQNNSVHWSSVPGCEIAKSEVAQYQLERGDILVARTGGTVGKTYLVQDVPVVAVFASYLIRIQRASAMFDRYLKLFLESPTYWVQLQEGARGAAQPNVNGQTLGRMVVSVPPLAEQKRIVAKVDELMALVDQLEVQLATSRTVAAQLTEAVVAELTAAA